jgi:hypothetical protein
MKRAVCFSFVVATFMATVVHAQATRTWVSGVGDDANPCSRTAPCKTFAGAISKTAVNGEIDVLEAGGFGVLTITKAIKIDGSYLAGGILASGTNGITVNAPAGATVILRNLSLDGGFTGVNTRGIRFLNGGTLIVDHCEIYGFTQRGISIELSANGAFFMNDSNVYSNLSNGIVVSPAVGTPTARVVLTNVNVHDNTNFGVFAGPGSIMTINGSRISGNGLAGLAADQSSGSTLVETESTIISDNGTGIQAGPGSSIVRISNTTVSNNPTNGFAFNGGTVFSYGNNHVVGNGGSNGPANGGTVIGNPQ